MSSLPVFLGRDEFPVGHCLAASPVAELEHPFYLPDLYPLGAGSSALRPPLPATRGPGFHCTSGGPVGQDVESRGLALLFFAPPEIAPVYAT